MIFTTDQRVNTPRGKATIIGFEAFDTKGKSLAIQPVDCGGRVVVRLDQPENWKATELTPNPYMGRRELSAIEPT